MTHIEQYLITCSELGAVCAENGCIDSRSLDCEILEQNDHHILAFVQFEEVLMEDSGRVIGRIAHQGRLRLTLDRYGQVERAELV
jgi:hypothetical protein